MDLGKVKEQFNHYAEKYDTLRKCFIPCFDDFYKRSVSLLKFYKNNFENIVDLGAGTGLLSKEIFELYPKSNYTLIDISNAMLKIAKERFNGLSNFTFLENNYVEDIPVNNCDLICSGMSIHHLENGEKEILYNNIYKKLDENGCFINLDLFNVKSEAVNNLYNNWWYTYIDNSGVKPEERKLWEEGKKLDKEISIYETIELLKNSGFKTVECIYTFMKFGVILAIK